MNWLIQMFVVEPDDIQFIQNAPYQPTEWEQKSC